jgi:amino acid adenylation domain-containing protein
MPKFFHELILRHARAHRSASAIATTRGSWSYEELAQKVDEFSTRMSTAGVGSADRVALVVHNGFEAIALITACSALGATFVPLDPNAPSERLRDLMTQVDPVLAIVSDDANIGADSTGVPTVSLVKGQILWPARMPRQRGSHKLLDVDLSHIVFTSGSSGHPKGIMMSHLATVSFLKGLCSFYNLTPGARYASCSPIHFDFALLDIGLCLGSGGTLVLPRPDAIRKPSVFVNDLVRMNVQHVSGVPSIWKLILKFAPETVPTLGQLERIVFAGEHFPLANVRKIYDALPQVRFVNIYGQSETIACTFTELPRPLPKDCKHLPVGLGHDDLELIVVDTEGNRVVKPFTVGELLLRGKLLFAGYWGNPPETRRRLIPNPFHPDGRETVFRTGDMVYFDSSGMFYFVGRRDNQVQVFGNRVELEEIETVLASHASVAHCCVVFTDGQHPELHSFVVPNSELADAGLVDTLRRHCGRLIPSYMCPRHFHVMAEMPLTPNGKVDRRALSERLDGHRLFG